MIDRLVDHRWMFLYKNLKKDMRNKKAEGWLTEGYQMMEEMGNS